MKILITGTAGFIGFHLTRALVERGDEVVALDIINDYYDINLKYGRLKELGFDGEELDYGKEYISSLFSNLKFIKADLQDKELIDNLFKKNNFDAVCNLGAQAGVRYSLENPRAYIDSNILGFINILEACRHHNVNNLSYASSSSVYGLNEKQPFSSSSNVDHPMSLYAATKKSNELMAHTYSHLYNIKTTGLRFFTVYGPWGRPDMALFLFTKAAFEGKSIDVFNHGKMLRDFTYVDDIVCGVINVIDNPASKDINWDGLDPNPSSSSSPYKVYNIGNNNPVQLMDFIKAIEAEVGSKIEMNMLPIQPGDVPSTYADVTDLVSQFDYKPDTSINHGIKMFVKWYKNYYEL